MVLRSMNNPIPSSIYSIDASSLMDWQSRFYPTDVFVDLARRIKTLIADERFLAPALVREEVEKVGTTELAEWVGSMNEMFIPTVEIFAAAQAIQNQFTGLRDPAAEYEEADAYVIALARMRNGIVVTGETSAIEKRKPKRSHYIPDVCRELGIPCIGFLGLMRREGWRF